MRSLSVEVAPARFHHLVALLPSPSHHYSCISTGARGASSCSRAQPWSLSVRQHQRYNSGDSTSQRNGWSYTRAAASLLGLSCAVHTSLETTLPRCRRRHITLATAAPHPPRMPSSTRLLPFQHSRNATTAVDHPSISILISISISISIPPLCLQLPSCLQTCLHHHAGPPIVRMHSWTMLSAPSLPPRSAIPTATNRPLLCSPCSTPTPLPPPLQLLLPRSSNIPNHSPIRRPLHPPPEHCSAPSPQTPSGVHAASAATPPAPLIVTGSTPFAQPSPR